MARDVRSHAINDVMQSPALNRASVLRMTHLNTPPNASPQDRTHRRNEANGRPRSIIGLYDSDDGGDARSVSSQSLTSPGSDTERKSFNFSDHRDNRSASRSNIRSQKTGNYSTGSAEKPPQDTMLRRSQSVRSIPSREVERRRLMTSANSPRGYQDDTRQTGRPNRGTGQQRLGKGKQKNEVDKFGEKLSQVCHLITDRHPEEFQIVEGMVELQEVYERSERARNQLVSGLTKQVALLAERVEVVEQTTLPALSSRLLQPLLNVVTQLKCELEDAVEKCSHERLIGEHAHNSRDALPDNRTTQRGTSQRVNGSVQEAPRDMVNGGAKLHADGVDQERSRGTGDITEAVQSEEPHYV